MLGESEIVYRDFWDVPRIFIVRHHERQYLFDCRFNKSDEDFERKYRIYAFPDLPESELRGSWEGFAERAERYLGEVPVESVSFDPSKRHRIDTRIIDELEDNAGGGGLR